MGDITKTQKSRHWVLSWHQFFVAISAVIGIVIVVGVPWWYDQANQAQYRTAAANGILQVRELREAYVPSSLRLAKPIEGADSGIANNIVTRNDIELIAADYVHKLQHAQATETKSFVAVLTLAVLLAGVGIFIAAGFVTRFASVGIAGMFLAPLILFYFLGLPHLNFKFHAVLGVLYATLLAVGHNMLTLKVPRFCSTSFTACLAALQYHHRFWTVAFSLSLTAIFALAATVSFSIRDAYVQVFGESYMEYPLLGTLLTLTIAIGWMFYCILRPIRSHLSAVETAMSQVAEADTTAQKGPTTS